MPHAEDNHCAHALYVAMLVLRHKQLSVLGAALACPCVCTMCLHLLLCMFGLSETLLLDSNSLCICPICLTCAAAV